MPHRKDLGKEQEDNEGSIRLELQLLRIDLVHSNIVKCSHHLSKGSQIVSGQDNNVEARHVSLDEVLILYTRPLVNRSQHSQIYSYLFRLINISCHSVNDPIKSTRLLFNRSKHSTT